MKLTTLLVFAVLCLSAVRVFGYFQPFVTCPNKVRLSLVDRWIRQKLDHFDKFEKRMWAMRYLANGRHFKSGGPIFIYLGGEGEIHEDPLLCGHFYDMAKQHNGYLFHTEHRYYGKSRPTEILETYNLRFLSAKQALADVAHFVSTIKVEFPGLANSKVIMAGGSYSGSLVVWFKHLYPDLIDGGWASSAPLLAKFGIPESTEAVGAAILALGGQQCYNRIESGIAQVGELFANGNAVQAKTILNTCQGFDESNDLDFATLFNDIFRSFLFYTMLRTENYIPNVCSAVMNGKYAAAGVGNFISLKHPPCFSASYSAATDTMLDNVDISGSRRWFYQLCNEFGWFMTSESPDQPFGQTFPLSYFTTTCAYLYGIEYTDFYIKQGIEETNDLFGGMNPNVQNVYMTQGEFDPWRHVGFNAKDGATIIPGAFHCSDFDSISSNDSPEMRASKEKIAQLVHGWVRV